MRKIIYFCVSILAAGVVFSCDKTIEQDDPHREKDLLEIKLQGQMGTAVIERDGDDATATLFILPGEGFSYSAVRVDGIAVSAYATANVGSGDVLNFSNPERKAELIVTSQSGESLEWTIYLQTYDPFYVGTWTVADVKLHCDQNISGSGNGVWDTQWWNRNAEVGNSEFGLSGMAEYDNVVTVTLNEGEVVNNRLTGTITNDAGPDGLYGNFYGIMAPHSVTEPLDMNPRLRHLLPPGESAWELDLTTQQMRISQNNITSTMIFANDGSTVRFRFILPSAADEPYRTDDNFYNNMWRSSTELFYVMSKE